MKCNKCGAHISSIQCWLKRVNEKGVDGIFECRPYCGAVLDTATRLEQAIADTPFKESHE